MLEKHIAYSDVVDDIRSGARSCRSLVTHFIAEINKREALNAFLEVFESSALQKADEVDAKISSGKAGKLAGMVVGIKDNIAYQAHHVSASSKILSGFESIYSATVVERLLAEDAIIIGRLNCDEFAMGSSNENSAYGPVRNPLDESRVPGGSSGGSAAAVAAGLCMVSLGSDTGGSIRQPASFCGIIGMKPTYGRISRWGLLAYGSSLDQIGPFAHTIEDVALLLEVMSGSDDYDTTASSTPVGNYSALKTNGVKRIAVLHETIEAAGIDPLVKQAVEREMEALKGYGYSVDVIDFPLLDALVPTYYVIANAEASSNLSRYDGVHYGYRSAESKDVNSTYVNSRSEGFGAEVKRRIMMGTFVLSAGYYDAYYAKAQKVRRAIVNRTQEIFEEYDLILSPTTPHGAFEIGAKNDDPVTMYLEDIFTVHANLAGLPAVSLPAGKNAQGMPLGVQLIANKFEEEKLLGVAHQLMNK